MAAYNPSSPRDGNRSLSPEVAARLRLALDAYWAEITGHDAELKAALSAAAHEARARGLRPEELLLALKNIEENAARTLKIEDTQDRDRFRIWVAGACMRAFFADEGTPDV